MLEELVIKMMGASAVVLGLIGLGAFALRKSKSLRNKFAGIGPHSRLRMKEAISIGGGKRCSVLSWGDKEYLILLSNQNNLLLDSVSIKKKSKKVQDVKSGR